MSATGKILLAGGLVVGGSAAYTAWKYNKMKMVDYFINNISVNVSDWKTAHIKVDLLMKNPTDFSFNFAFPYVVLHYQGIPVSSSQSIPKTIQLPAHGEQLIKDIDISISIFSVSIAIPKLIADLVAKRPVELDAILRTSVPMLGPFIHVGYEKKKTIHISGPKQLQLS